MPGPNDHAEAKPITLDEWMEQIRAEHLRSSFAIGACIVKDPHTNVSNCIQTTSTVCAKIKGTFVGGACGGG